MYHYYYFIVIIYSRDVGGYMLHWPICVASACFTHQGTRPWHHPHENDRTEVHFKEETEGGSIELHVEADVQARGSRGSKPPNHITNHTTLLFHHSRKKPYCHSPNNPMKIRIIACQSWGGLGCHVEMFLQ